MVCHIKVNIKDYKHTAYRTLQDIKYSLRDTSCSSHVLMCFERSQRVFFPSAVPLQHLHLSHGFSTVPTRFCLKCGHSPGYKEVIALTPVPISVCGMNVIINI